MLFHHGWCSVASGAGNTVSQSARTASFFFWTVSRSSNATRKKAGGPPNWAYLVAEAHA
ncbi:hypothetical protein [Ramlibacter montanisoli]|uniref:Uncharacterized protein n=1 Tax=Ramlibacter montanisoli TaxID=2732512 RepID=A0A849KAB1_9BURK|nr:hypothetical protein [Ramlibacter montanisoli]NNU43354.1 hypothetical protein [Ramlibacter montanisoli]